MPSSHAGTPLTGGRRSNSSDGRLRREGPRGTPQAARRERRSAPGRASRNRGLRESGEPTRGAITSLFRGRSGNPNSIFREGVRRQGPAGRPRRQMDVWSPSGVDPITRFKNATALDVESSHNRSPQGGLRKSPFSLDRYLSWMSLFSTFPSFPNLRPRISAYSFACWRPSAAFL